MAEPLSAISSIVRDVLRDNGIDVTAATRFEDLTGWDSMDIVAVVVEVECRFNLQFELLEIDRLSTVDDLLHMIEAKQALAAA